MNNVRCLECDSEDVNYLVTDYGNALLFSYYKCISCRWWMYVEEYNGIIREISQKAL